LTSLLLFFSPDYVKKMGFASLLQRTNQQNIQKMTKWLIFNHL
jgi:hypothetical protein